MVAGRWLRWAVAVGVGLGLVLSAGSRVFAGEEESAKSVLEEGHTLFRQSRYAEATAQFERAVAAAESSSEARVLVEALAMQARGLLALDRKEEGRKVLARAATLAKEDQPLDWTCYLATRGRFEWKAGQNAEASRTFEAMYGVALENGLFDRAVDAAHMVGLTGTPEQQLAWAQKGIEAAEKGEMDGWLGPLWNNLGLTHETAGRYEEALASYRKARGYHWKVGTERNKLAADWAIGHTHRLLRQWKEAGAWLRPVLAWAERLDAEMPEPENAEWVGSASKELGLVLAATGREAEALPLLARAQEILGAAKMAEWDPAGWKDLLRAIEAVQGQANPAGSGVK